MAIPSVLLAAVLGAVEPAAQPPAVPAAAAVRPVVDEYYGVKIEDPYRWIEDLRSEETRAWIDAQAHYAQALLARIPGRAKLLARMEEIDASAPPRIAASLFDQSPRRLPGDLWFYERRDANQDVQKLYVRHGLSGTERLLVDPETFRAQTGKPHAINYFEPSPDGRYVAYGISAAGSEAASIYVVEVETAKVVDGPIDRADYGAVSWVPGTRGFFYNRLQALGPDAPRTDKYLNSKDYHHVVGRPTDQDEVVFARGTPGVEANPEDTPVVAAAPGSRWALGVVAHGVQREVTIYAASLARATAPGAPWTRVVDVPDAVVDAALLGDELYLLTHAGAPHYKVTRLRLGNPKAKAVEVIAPGAQVLLGLSAAKDALYVRARDGAVMRLLRAPYRGGRAADVPLPADGILGIPSADPRLDGLVLTISSWTALPQVYVYDPATRTMRDTRLQPTPAFASGVELEVTHDWATSHDGTKVPLTVIHRRGVARDGSSPAVLFGYGAYGISQDPRFDPLRLAWFEAGGVWAYCHVRGGGEYGEEWYRAGQKATKPNTWKDAIACGERLVQDGYTTPARLAIVGGSAGGIYVGRAITERPDLFRVAVPLVGLVDALRFETTPNGVPNVPEFGTVKTEEGFQGLLAMSTYHHVKDGVAYPAVIASHGINDPRVDAWQSAKLVARLQAATSSGRPVLLRIDFDSGHGIGDARSQERVEWADLMSFILWQTGQPGFQPGAAPAR
ncbi:MAG TPA: prolyl oligopeptidase family serine peptidase [Anaeromyxobacteraceae bacterium]|nr:prolyl oligopeptidase family serine peptidase [Anaeromyxobacteraceae bacterium]